MVSCVDKIPAQQCSRAVAITAMSGVCLKQLADRPWRLGSLTCSVHFRNIFTLSGYYSKEANIIIDPKIAYLFQLVCSALVYCMHTVFMQKYCGQCIINCPGEIIIFEGIVLSS